MCAAGHENCGTSYVLKFYILICFQIFSITHVPDSIEVVACGEAESSGIKADHWTQVAIICLLVIADASAK
jgi:hypothetical protein